MINLLPYNEKDTIQRIRVLRMVTVTLWSAIAVMSILCLLLLPSMTIITTRYGLAQNEITRLENAGVVVRPEAIEETQVRAKNTEQQFVSTDKLLPNSAFAIARSTVPTGITLSGFTFTSTDSQRLMIVGVVTTREVLQRYVESIQKDDRVAMVDSPITNYLKQKDNEFTLTVTFK